MYTTVAFGAEAVEFCCGVHARDDRLAGYQVERSKSVDRGWRMIGIHSVPNTYDPSVPDAPDERAIRHRREQLICPGQASLQGEQFVGAHLSIIDRRSRRGKANRAGLWITSGGAGPSSRRKA